MNVGGVWQNVSDGPIAADGSFAVEFELWTLGNHQYRLLIPASLRLAAVASPARAVNVGRLTITTTSLPGATVGTAYSATLRQTFAEPPVSWSLTRDLPDDLTLSGAGVLSGTPTAAGSFTVDFTATDERGQQATKRLTLLVAESSAPVILDSKFPAGQVDVGYASGFARRLGTRPSRGR